MNGQFPVFRPPLQFTVFRPPSMESVGLTGNFIQRNIIFTPVGPLRPAQTITGPVINWSLQTTPRTVNPLGPLQTQLSQLSNAAIRPVLNINIAGRAVY